jgi:hypothetical protein
MAKGVDKEKWEVYEGEFKENKYDGVGVLKKIDVNIRYGEFKVEYIITEFWTKDEKFNFL